MNVLEVYEKYDELRNKADVIKKAKNALKDSGNCSQWEGLLLSEIHQDYMKKVMDLQEKMTNTQFKV